MIYSLFVNADIWIICWQTNSHLVNSRSLQTG